MANRLDHIQLMIYQIGMKADVPARAGPIYDIEIVARLRQFAISGLRIDSMHETLENKQLGEPAHSTSIYSNVNWMQQRVCYGMYQEPRAEEVVDTAGGEVRMLPPGLGGGA